MEIERRFLIKALSNDVASLPGALIQQGYLVVEQDREVRVRQYKEQCWLTVKGGQGLVRDEVEIPISQAHFDQLYALTEGRRIEKIRRVLILDGVKIEIDAFEGIFSPLMIAEVEFSTVEASASYRVPAFFGTEITTRHEYRNSWMALHGVPSETNKSYQIATLPFLVKSGVLHVVIVTNSSKTRWILPKGHPEPNMTRQEVAMMEAMEEAGVIGTIPTGFSDKFQITKTRKIHLFPLRISTILKKWPESSVRKRQVLPLMDALKLLNDPKLEASIHRLLEKLPL